MISQVRDMTSGKPAKQILFFALPLMLGNVLQQTYIMVDTMVVGNFIGVKALAAIGAADWLNWMILSMVIGFCQGFSLLVSQYFGAEDYDGLRKSIAMSVILAAIIAVIATAVFLPTAESMLVFMNTPASIIKDSLSFLRIIFSGIIITTAYNTMSSILRALGNSKTPLIAMACASVVNIILDLVFILWFHWGLVGAAAATVTAQLFSCVFCFYAIKNIPLIRLKRKDWIPDKAVITQLIRLGTPMAFQNAIIGVGGAVVQYVINGFGVIFVAGFTAVMKLYGLLELAGTSFGYAIASFTGQNLGAQKYDRIRKGMNSALKMAISIALIISAATLLFGRSILRLFISGSPGDVNAVVDVGYNYLRIMSILLFILYMLYLHRSALQGMGDTVIPMISGIVELFMRIGAVVVLPMLVGRYGVYYAEVIAWFGAEVVLISTYYYRMRRLYRLKKDANCSEAACCCTEDA